MKNFRLIFALVSVVFMTAFLSCGSDSDDVSSTETPGSEDTTDDATSENGEDHDSADDYTWDESAIVEITLSGTFISVNGSGATVDGTTVTINSSGVYRITGSLSDGQVIVNSDDEATVKILLNGVDITCSDSAPIFVEDAEKVVVYLTTGTTNELTDGTNYVLNSDEEPNATLFSKSDLTIFGEGYLVVDGNYNDAIGSKDGLIIASGTFTINAVDDGIRGKDYLIIKDGSFDITSGGDGLSSDNEDNTELGYIFIQAGTFDITSTSGDGIQAETDLLISDGDFTIKTGSGGTSTYSGTDSKKGLKGVVSIIVDGGTFNISSNDDALHSNNNIAINGGEFVITSGDDGIHADTELGINGGTIKITKSYEGIESSLIRINDGDINIVASDDGVNVAGGNDSSGQGGYTQTGNYYLYINGGNIVVNATGDGLDANGSIEMSDGVVIVNGPTSSGNGALDYDRTFKITGGFFIAVGSSGMAQAPGTSSSQYSVMVTFKSTVTAGKLFNIQTSTGEEIVTFAPVKSYQCVVFSSPNLKSGSSYNVYYGGSSTGTAQDGLYEGGAYTGGTLYKSFTISGIVSKVS